MKNTQIEKMAVTMLNVMLQKLKLQKNMSKPSWKNDAPQYFLKRIKDEVEELSFELKDVFNYNIDENHKESIISECADIANFCAMLVDNLKNKPEV